ncbi:hypothetical protein ACHAWU_001212 [Discostella pseudostelligera]|uniref:Enkurin domain-containing protein n=1 Tax=Discostella pseudostelligera TaxID=259834 RepID=A0ABD3MZ12_9STRA
MIVTYDNDNLSPRGLAAIIARRHMSGVDAKSLIALEEPSVEASNQTCASDKNSPSTKPKNNLKAIRLLHKENQCNNKDIEFERREKQKLRLQKLERKTMNHVAANRRALKEKQRNKKEADMERQAKELSRQKAKAEHGNIRSKILDPAASSSHSSPNERSCSSSFSNYSTRSNGPAEYRIAFGKKTSSSAAPRQSIDVDSSVLSLASSSMRHKSYGKVPTYITDRKAKIEREEEEQRRLKENAPPAPGLVLMDESERLETLRLLEENEKQARDELRNIPFKMNHQRAARLRQAIDYRLKEIEDTRKIFSKAKVFVAKNDDL